MQDETRQPPRPAPGTREERLAQALRDNLNRRKQLARSKKARDAGAGNPPREDE